MAKAKTLRKRKKSLESIPKLRLKKGRGVKKHDPFKLLINEKLVAQAFWDCLKENDPNGALEIISAHLNALNKVEIAKAAEMPRSTIYYSMKSKNPTLKTMAKLIHATV